MYGKKKRFKLCAYQSTPDKESLIQTRITPERLSFDLFKTIQTILLLNDKTK